MADQGDFTSGDVLTAADLNAFRQVTILSETVSLPNSTNVTPTFSTEIIDVGGWHASGSNSIVAPYDGVYLVSAQVIALNANARGLVVITNATAASTIASTDDANGANDLSATAHAEMSAGDNIRLLLFQASGTTKTPLVYFSMELVRRT